MGMSRFVAAVFAGAFALSAVGAAQAGEEGLYFELRGFGGYTDPGDISSTNTGPLTERNTTDLTAGGGAAIGWTFGDIPLRVEAEIMHRVRTDVDLRDTANGIGYENNLSSTTAMIGVAYEFRNDSPYTPFIGGHLGMAQNSSEVDRTNLNTRALSGQDNDVTNAAFGISLGLDSRLTEVVDFTASYRFTHVGSFETGTLSGGETIEGDPIMNHDLVLGFRFNF